MTGDGRCTSNFVFYDSRNVYLGQAAHCSAAAVPEKIDGCQAQSLPLGTPVEIEGASRPGTLVYNSWIAMQASGEEDPNTCLYNDFALVRVDPADEGRVNPSVPYWGGPTGLATSTAEGERVLTYTNSPIRGARGLLNPVEGTSLGQEAGGWTHSVLIVLPGIPGDSGSGFLNSRGEAFGTLSTLDILPRPLSNGVSDLSRELDYMRARSRYRDVMLATGTEPFRAQPSNFLADLLRGIIALL